MRSLYPIRTVREAFTRARMRWEIFQQKKPDVALLLERQLTEGYHTDHRAQFSKTPLFTYAVVMLDATADRSHFSYFGTSCGTHGNRCFGNPLVQRALAVTRRLVVGAVSGSDGSGQLDLSLGVHLQMQMFEIIARGVEKQGFIPFDSVAVNVPDGSLADAFARLVERKGGSLRPDNCRAPGWTWFESE